MDRDQVYKKVYDSTPMNNFIYEINRNLVPKFNNKEKE